MTGFAYPTVDPADYALQQQPCSRCLPLAFRGKIPARFVMPLPSRAAGPTARDGSGPCCDDCASADSLLGLAGKGMDFAMARIVIGNDRDDQFRLPGAAMGMAQNGIMKRNNPGDLDLWFTWAAHHGFGPYGDDDED